jgi:hypothetical protein
VNSIVKDFLSEIDKVLADRVSWLAEYRIDKFRDPNDEIATLLRSGMSLAEIERAFQDRLIGSEEWEGNLGLNEGIGELLDLACGLGSPTAFDNAHAYIGVGDSNTAPAASQTGLQASSNKTWKPMDSGYPSRTNQTVTFRATFGSGDANYSWQEYTVVNASSDTGKNLNRCTSDKGTKASGETWTLSVAITMS